MPDSEKFRLSQIRNFLHTLWTDKSDPPKLTLYEQWCSGNMDQRGGISIINSSLADKANTPAYAQSWETDLEIQLHPDKWIQAFCISYKGIQNISLIEASVTVFMRWYYVPARLSKIYPDTSGTEDAVMWAVGTVLHIWWTCS